MRKHWLLPLKFILLFFKLYLDPNFDLKQAQKPLC